MGSPVRVLYDGWPLIYQPSSPSALHLWEIISLLPEEVTPILALPDEPPTWLDSPPEMVLRSIAQENTARGRLRWEQRLLPQLAEELEVDLAHLTHSHPALHTGVPVVISPCESETVRRQTGFTGRLRSALGRGGMASVRGILWPSDLPRPDSQTASTLLPPVVHPSFTTPDQTDEPAVEIPDLPETFILFHGSYDPIEVRTLLDAWVWGAGALGDYYPLLLLSPQEAAEELNDLAERYNFGKAVQILPSLPPPAISMLYRKASAMIHPGIEVPWGGAIRHALACAVPVVTTDHSRNSALVGAAAYTIPANDPRKLGASLITVIVEEAVAQRLSEAAREQTASWNSRNYRSSLGDVYRRITEESS